VEDVSLLAMAIRAAAQVLEVAAVSAAAAVLAGRAVAALAAMEVSAAAAGRAVAAGRDRVVVKGEEVAEVPLWHDRALRPIQRARSAPLQQPRPTPPRSL